ncbi:MAG: O-antigen ligase family protein [Actinomycetia bacterium]|nr:O-antigen ligase family protein [Actinomycetes bacterium]
MEFLNGSTAYMMQGSTDRGKIFLGLNIAHNATGSVYALVSVFALIFFLEEKAKKVKILYSIVFLLCVAGLFLSKSKGSYIAFSITAIFVLWMYLKSVKKFFIILSALIVISIPVLWVTNTIERFTQILQTKGTTASRLELWEKAWNLFSKSPVVGVGFGRFNDIRSAIYENLAGQEGVLSVFLHPRFYFGSDHAHNSYLQFLAETGIVGLSLLLIFWCLCFQIIFKALKSAKDNYSKKVFLAGLAGIVNLFILSFTENYFSSTTIMVASSMIVSLCIGLAWQENSIKR